MEKVGKEGVITIADGNTLYNELEVVESMKLDRGYISPYCVTSPKTQNCKLEDPLILIHDKKVSNFHAVVKVLELALKKQKPLLIVAEDVESEALGTLIINKLRAGIKVCVVKTPGFGENRKANLQDLAILTGGKVITEELGMNLENFEPQMLGSCKKVTVTKDDTVILDGAGDKKSIEERAEQIRSAIEQSTSDYDKEKLQERLAKLSGGIVVLKIGGASEVKVGKDIMFTYDVDFKESDIKWASRWDSYLLMTDDQIPWFSIVNSLMIVLFLSGRVAMIMPRTLYRDISKYNQLETQEEAQEETGWKFVHSDVFRSPSNADWLCVYVGTGVQFFGMLLVSLVFAVLGFLSPSNRGGLMTARFLLWVFMRLLAGYTSSRLYKLFKGSEWKNIALRTAFPFPGSMFAIFFFLNALIWGQKSSGAVPFTTMFALVLLWFGISVPLVFVGSFLGFKKPAIEDPVKTNKIPRQIPEQAWYMNPVFSILIGGILPFGAVFIELFFILTSIWLQQFYYIFGFLFLVFLILIVTCAEISIVLCYFQLCSEDYLWWWRSYLTSGSSALYLFLYATFYFFTKLEITKFVSALLYFGYMLIASYAFFALTGTIGFYACFLFTRLIYSSVKIE